MNLRRLYALFVARNMEFFRDRAALGWNLLMPLLLVLGLSLALGQQDKALYQVGVLHNADSRATTHSGFLALQHIRFIPQSDQAAAIARVARHRLDLLVDPQQQRYWINANSSKGYLLEKILQGVDVAGPAWSRQAVEGTPIRYVDWVIPGILGMNMMFSALYGVGYVIVRYRKNGVLKRLSATPLKVSEFLLAQLGSRLWIILGMGTAVYIGLNLLLDFRMYGNYFVLLLVFFIGVISMIALGLIVASRLATEEVAEGLLNFLSWPMLFLSGVWFSLDGAHPAVKALANLFPLTHLTTAARKVMLDGAGLVDVLPQLLILSGMASIFFVVGIALFRWEA